jgi:hypothetical protein
MERALGDSERRVGEPTAGSLTPRAFNHGLKARSAVDLGVACEPPLVRTVVNV